MLTMNWPNDMPPYRKDLSDLWKSIPEHSNVPINSFYSEENIYSNMKKHEKFEFVFPKDVMQTWTPKSVSNIRFSEKAMMLCKASLMDNLDNFHKILKCSEPEEALELGR